MAASSRPGSRTAGVLIKSPKHRRQLLSRRETVPVDLVKQPKYAVHFHVMTLRERPELGVANPVRRVPGTRVRVFGKVMRVSPLATRVENNAIRRPVQ